MEKYKKLFFIGIGGIGISALARQMAGRGVEISGSDIAESEVTKRLRSSGITVTIGQTLELIPKDVDMVIFTNSLKKYQPEFLELVQKNFKTKSYPELLGEVSKGFRTVAVSGTHGKTTTTAMVGTILKDADKDPTVVVGSLLTREKSNFIQGKSDIFVTEADEYQRAFHALYPTVLAITNIDLDHLDYYKDLADIQSAFHELAMRVPENGVIICNPNHDHVAPVIVGAKARVVDYSKISESGIELQLPGFHNIEDAKVAIAVAEYFAVSRAEALISLMNFQGTWRRFEFKGETIHGALVYDEYAHNPQKVRAAIAGAKEKFPDKKITVVFQPHLYSRTTHLFKDFVHSFDQADDLILAPIYAAREHDDGSISHKTLADAISERGKKVYAANDFAEMANIVRNNTGENDVILVVGAGDITELATTLVSE